MPRQPYTPCKLYYDAIRTVSVGDYLLTRAGSAYLVQAVRPDKKRLHRKHLQCVRWPSAEVPVDAVVHPLQWYPRGKRKGRRLS